jgi:hypothetical protein
MTDPCEWIPANNGGGKRMWFVMRGESVPIALRYHFDKNGRLVRYASCEAAQRAADKLNVQKASQ